MTLQIKKATKSESKLRMSLIGASGSGKTFTALSVGSNLGTKILFIDTERGSASKYADLFEFDVIELGDFAPERFIEAIKAGESNGYDVVIIDSLSHEWIGKGGILELHEAAEKRTRNKFTAWAEVTPRHNSLIEAIVQAKTHVIATMRAKTDYSMTKDERGKTTVESVGLAPIQRDGMEYEFDVVAHLDQNNNFIVKKSRCPFLSEKVFPKAGLEVAEILKVWLQGVPQTTVKMPTAPLEIVKPTAPVAPPTEQSKADYSEEWNDKIGAAISPTPIQPKSNPGPAGNLSPAGKGKLLAEAGNVSRKNFGYECVDNVGGVKITARIEKKNNVIQCSCDDYADGISDRAGYQCAHIEAVKYFASTQQQKAA